MTNYEYINFINSKLVLYKKTNTYYINIGPLFGYNDCTYFIFIILNEKVSKSYITTKNDIYDLLILVKNNELYKLLTGTENLKFGIDYLISESLYNYILTNETNYEYSDKFVNYILPDYIIDLKPNENDYESLDNINIEYYLKLNEINNFEFNIEELNNFYITFCNIILDNAYINDISNEYYIYKTVLEYWANGGTDMASTNISLILNSSINVYNTNQSYTICGCNTNNDNNNNNINTLSCNELYKNAMLLHLKEMLGNSDFYESWFMLEDGNINEVMIKKLLLLIDEFLKLDYNIYSNIQTDKKMSKCNCEVISGDDCNFSIIKDYKNVLYWVNENKILENKNKIYILGTNFGEILPKLIF